MNWWNANAWAAGLNPYGSGITGWRLPTVSPIDGTTADDATLAYNGTEDRGYNVSAPGTLYMGSAASEMAHMFYNTLGDKAYFNTSGVAPQAGWGLTNTGPFSNLKDNYYWSATEYAPTHPSNSAAWGFDFYFGSQDFNYLNHDHSSYYAWAVHDGDVGVAIPSAVPIPAAAWLFGSGLLGLIGIARKRKH